MTSLRALNAKFSMTREWSGWTLRCEYRIGRSGQQNARRGRRGSHLHLLEVEVVIAKDFHAAGSIPVGDYAAIRGCVANGQFTGTVIEGFEDLSRIDCARCVERLEKLLDAALEK